MWCGNFFLSTAFNEEIPSLFIHACDFSKRVFIKTMHYDQNKVDSVLNHSFSLVFKINCLSCTFTSTAHDNPVFSVEP